jgi:hypothetical protein
LSTSSIGANALVGYNGPPSRSLLAINVANRDPRKTTMEQFQKLHCVVASNGNLFVLVIRLDPRRRGEANLRGWGGWFGREGRDGLAGTLRSSPSAGFRLIFPP